MLITKQIEIDAGHRVPNHKSKCRSPHGHRYRIEVGIDDKVIETKGASNEGMVVDFSDVKNVLINTIEAVYDHSFIIYRDDLNLLKALETFNKAEVKDGKKKTNIQIVDFIPTAENLAKHWWELLLEAFNHYGVKLYYVKVWETPTSTAQYGG